MISCALDYIPVNDDRVMATGTNVIELHNTTDAHRLYVFLQTASTAQGSSYCSLSIDKQSQPNAGYQTQILQFNQGIFGNARQMPLIGTQSEETGLTNMHWQKSGLRSIYIPPDWMLVLKLLGMAGGERVITRGFCFEAHRSQPLPTPGDF